MSTVFQPTRPLRGATPAPAEPAQNITISTHAPLAGRDCSVRDSYHKFFIFQPTRPLRGATVDDSFRKDLFEISTHAPLAGRDVLRLLALRAEVISTHAPLAGRDLVVEHFKPLADISTHAPLAGRDVLHHLCHLVFDISTHAPLAGRDITNLCRTLLRMDFNPRAPCGARPVLIRGLDHTAQFQPTRPLRGATTTR